MRSIVRTPCTLQHASRWRWAAAISSALVAALAARCGCAGGVVPLWSVLVFDAVSWSLCGSAELLEERAGDPCPALYLVDAAVLGGITFGGLEVFAALVLPVPQVLGPVAALAGMRALVAVVAW